MEIENYPAAYMINWKQHKKGLAGRTMAKKQQQSIELDYEQKRMANLFGKNLTEADGVRRFWPKAAERRIKTAVYPMRSSGEDFFWKAK